MGVSLLFLLPAFTAYYRWQFSRFGVKSAPTITPGDPTERTPLLSDEEQVTADAEPAPPAPPSEEPPIFLSASQDLVLARISLFIDAVSAVWMSTVQTTVGIAIGTCTRHIADKIAVNVISISFCVLRTWSTCQPRPTISPHVGCVTIRNWACVYGNRDHQLSSRHTSHSFPPSLLEHFL